MTKLHELIKDHHLAKSSEEKANILKKIIALTPEVNVNKKKRKYITPLRLATVYKQKDICVLLVQNGAKVNAKDWGDSTPLIFAAWYNRKDICQLLLENGANINKIDGSGKTALDWATNMGNEETIKLLKDFSFVLNAETLPEVIKRYYDKFPDNNRLDTFPTLRDLQGMKIKAFDLNNKNIQKWLPLPLRDHLNNLPLFFNNYVKRETYIVTRSLIKGSAPSKTA